jgi:hypothetical protein
VPAYPVGVERLDATEVLVRDQKLIVTYAECVSTSPRFSSCCAGLKGLGLAAAPVCAQRFCDEHHVQQRDELERVFGPTFWLTVYYNNLVNEDYDLYRDMC